MKTLNKALILMSALLVFNTVAQEAPSAPISEVDAIFAQCKETVTLQTADDFNKVIDYLDENKKGSESYREILNDIITNILEATKEQEVVFIAAYKARRSSNTADLVCAYNKGDMDKAFNLTGILLDAKFKAYVKNNPELKNAITANNFLKITRRNLAEFVVVFDAYIKNYKPTVKIQ
ncbi:MAG: hypothetical protein ACI9TY_000153 [Alphaproteobacteria bacterium]|jgi:uncharacterized protein YabN with tetrapyrrole methylase and pyrophosphatase domain